MTDRTLVLCPPRNAAYRDLCLNDSHRHRENPVALKVDSLHDFLVAGRWLDVADRLVVYDDFGIHETARHLVADAEAMGLDVEIRTLGNRPRRTIRERLAEFLA